MRPRSTGDAGGSAGVSVLRGASAPVRRPETPAKGRLSIGSHSCPGNVHPDRPLRAGRLRCERRTCQHPSHDGEELKRRKADKQHDQRAFNRQAALPSPFQAMKLVNRRGPGNGVGRHDIAPNTCRMGFAVSACGSVCARSPYLRCVARRAKRYRLRRGAMTKARLGVRAAPFATVADANPLREAHRRNLLLSSCHKKLTRRAAQGRRPACARERSLTIAPNNDHPYYDEIIRSLRCRRQRTSLMKRLHR